MGFWCFLYLAVAVCLLLEFLVWEDGGFLRDYFLWGVVWDVLGFVEALEG